MASNQNKELEKVTEEVLEETNILETTATDVLQKNAEIASNNLEKTVTIRLPREKKSSGDVFVSVNERTWLIKRGVSIEVPECVAEVLRNQEKMLDEAYTFEEQVMDKE